MRTAHVIWKYTRPIDAQIKSITTVTKPNAPLAALTLCTRQGRKALARWDAQNRSGRRAALREPFPPYGINASHFILGWLRWRLATAKVFTPADSINGLISVWRTKKKVTAPRIFSVFAAALNWKVSSELPPQLIYISSKWMRTTSLKNSLTFKLSRVPCGLWRGPYSTKSTFRLDPCRASSSRGRRRPSLGSPNRISLRCRKRRRPKGVAR